MAEPTGRLRRLWINIMNIGDEAKAKERCTGGFAQDITIEARPWGFDPASIVSPVCVIHGEEDTLVPLAQSRHTVELIPGASLEILPGHGHISLFSELPRLSAELAATLR